MVKFPTPLNEGVTPVGPSSPERMHRLAARAQQLLHRREHRHFHWIDFHGLLSPIGAQCSMLLRKRRLGGG